MASGDGSPTKALLDELSRLGTPGDLGSLLAAHPELRRPETVAALDRRVVQLARSDLRRAEALSRVVTWLAEELGDDLSLALALKSRGHMRYLAGRYESALELYRACQQKFFAAGHEVEAATNMGSSLWMLALTGRYSEASADAERARRILERHGDRLKIARLDNSEASILLRQDRHPEAIARFERALAAFRRGGEDQDVVVALHNIAVSAIAIHDFDKALASYEELGEHCARCEMPLAAIRADYNIAYLYYFRGEYTRAIEVYQKTRRKCEELGDAYHRALCDLDQAEIYLELNLEDQGRRLAERARRAFAASSNGYETAKATTFLGIAAEQRGDLEQSSVFFAEARDRFEAENNGAWMALTDLYRALLLLRLEETRQARELGERAHAFFVAADWPAKVALCDMLLSRIELEEGNLPAARQRSAAAHRRLLPLDLPAMSFQQLLLDGQLLEAGGEPAAALEAYRRAATRLEDLRSHLGSEELKIAFLGDKLEVYESLVWLTLRGEVGAEEERRAFAWAEQAKSRTLADMIAFRSSALPASQPGSAELVASLRAQRETLSNLYHELDQARGLRTAAAVEPAPPSAPQAPARERQMLAELTRRCRDGEESLLGTLKELQARDPELSALQSATTVDLTAVQRSLPRDSLLVELFTARGNLWAFVAGRDRFLVRDLGPIREIRDNLRALYFQLSKFQLPPDLLEDFFDTVRQTTRRCLERLYAALIEPIADHLDARHLVFVPHGPLHQVPFHALHDGERYLIDRYSISYAPSASVYATCSSKRTLGGDPPLILGLPDAQAPNIAAEVESVAELLPDARVFIGREATLERLRDLGPGCRSLHIATHGFFRQDNPMFSAITLGDSRLTLFDLYELRLGAGIVVLSGCSTGLHVVESGDELIGLTRGLLYAGATSVLASLWDVHDLSTSTFMRALYRHLQAGRDRADAVARAMRDLRREYPEPYHWAPFVLVGQALSPGAGKDGREAV